MEVPNTWLNDCGMSVRLPSHGAEARCLLGFLIAFIKSRRGTVSKRSTASLNNFHRVPDARWKKERVGLCWPEDETCHRKHTGAFFLLRWRVTEQEKAEPNERKARRKQFAKNNYRIRPEYSRSTIHYNGRAKPATSFTEEMALMWGGWLEPGLENRNTCGTFFMRFLHQL